MAEHHTYDFLESKIAQCTGIVGLKKKKGKQYLKASEGVKTSKGENKKNSKNINKIIVT